MNKTYLGAEIKKLGFGLMRLSRNEDQIDIELKEMVHVFIGKGFGYFDTSPVYGIGKSANPGASLVSWAIRYSASFDGIITVLSGMSNMEQMDDNIAYMENFVPLTEPERAVIEEARRVLENVETIRCTGCRYWWMAAL